MTLSEDESRFVLSRLRAFLDTLTKRESNCADQIRLDLEILSLFESIFGTRSVAHAFLYLCRNGATTSWLLQVHLGMPESTAFRVLKLLRVKRVVEPVLRLPRSVRRDGPIHKVWGLAGQWTDEDVANCIVLHNRSLSPKYRAAEKVAQTIIDEYFNKRQVREITFREILIHIKEIGVPYRTSDIAELAAQYLFDKGMKVWR